MVAMADSILDVAKRADLFFMEKSPIHQAQDSGSRTESEVTPFSVSTRE
jgi:hypothetical protein